MPGEPRKTYVAKVSAAEQSKTYQLLHLSHIPLATGARAPPMLERPESFIKLEFLGRLYLRHGPRLATSVKGGGQGKQGVAKKGPGSGSRDVIISPFGDVVPVTCFCEFPSYSRPVQDNKIAIHNASLVEFWWNNVNAN